MKIVVTTPTGNVGSLLAPLLVRAGVRPTLLARDATRIDPALRDACDVVEADQGDGDAVAAATRGADALYWVDPPTPDDDPLDGYRRMGESAAHAVRTNRIPRVVFQSSVGAEARQGFGEIDGLGLTEELLDATGADVTHLRNGATGASRWRIVTTLVVPEALGPLILGFTFVFVAVVDMSALAGTLDGGGLGAFALDYGYKRWNFAVVWVTVLVIILLVQVAQALGNRLSRKVLRR